MKILLQTNLTPVLTVYDSQKEEDLEPSDGPSFKSIYHFLRPVVQLHGDEGSVIYKTGDFYSSALFYTPVVLFGVVLIVAYLIARR